MKRLRQVRSQWICHIMMWPSVIARILTGSFDCGSRFTEQRQRNLNIPNHPCALLYLIVLVLQKITPQREVFLEVSVSLSQQSSLFLFFLFTFCRIHLCLPCASPSLHPSNFAWHSPSAFCPLGTSSYIFRPVLPPPQPHFLLSSHPLPESLTLTSKKENL